MPFQIGEHGKRGDQNIIPLAWHDRANCEETHDAVAAAARERYRIYAGASDGDAIGRDRVFGGEKSSRGRTRHDNAPGACERGAFADAEAFGLRGG